MAISGKDIPLVPSWRFLFLDLVSTIFWVYGITKVFFGDFDIYLTHGHSILTIIVEYRYFIFFPLLLSLLVLFGKKRGAWSILYIVGFPIIVMLWKIPILLVKAGSWSLALAAFNMFLSGFTDLKYRSISLFLYVLAFILACKSHEVSILWLSIGLICLLISISYVKRFIDSIRTPKIYNLYKKSVSGIEKFLDKNYTVEESFRGLSIEKIEQNNIEKWNTNLQHLLVYSRLCLYFARRMEVYQKSELGYVFGIISILRLFILTVVSFSFVAFALDKLGIIHVVSGSASYAAIYVEYAFNNMYFSGTDSVSGSGTWFIIILMFERFLSLLLITILVSILFTISGRKHSSEIADTIESLRKSSEKFENKIRKDFNFSSIDEATIYLKKVKSSMADFLVYITEDIN